MTKGEALDQLQKALGVSGTQAGFLLSQLPSPHSGDESIPDPIIAELIRVQLEAHHPQSEKDFENLGRPQRSGPPPKPVTAIALAAGPNGSYVAALDSAQQIWLWVEGADQWQALPAIGEDAQSGRDCASSSAVSKITYALDTREALDNRGPEHGESAE